MNWKFLLSTSLALSIIFVILMTVVLYIKFKSDNKKKKTSAELNPNEGRYFKKFQLKPTDLNESNDSEAESQRRRERAFNKLIFYIPFIILFLVAGYLWVFHQSLFHEKVILTNKELSDMKVESRQWKPEVSPLRPKLTEILGPLRKKNIRLVISKDGLNFKVPGSGRRISSEALASWEVWLEKNEITYDLCTKDQLTDCLSGKNKIYVLLPDFWTAKDLNTFHSRSFRVILSGVPLQVFLDTQAWSWKDLQFRKDNHPEKGLVALAADRELTLGWSPGALLSINRFFAGVHVKASKSQAFRMSETFQFSDSLESSLSASTSSTNSRYVWMDFLPTEKESERPQVTNDLMAGVFRYLLGLEYSAVAAWPEGKEFPVGLVINVNEFNSSLKTLEPGKLAYSFFGFSRFLEKNRSSMSSLKDKGNIHCQSDIDRDFDRISLLEQSKAIALCQKTLQSLLNGNRASGLQPPGEKYSDDTFSAASHFGMDFVFVHHLKQFSPQPLRDIKSSFTINLIPRMFSDDHFFFEKNKFSQSDVERLLHREINVAKSLGVPYLYRTHSHRLSMDEFTKIDAVLKDVSARDSTWKASLSELSQWWRVRSNLNAGISLSETDFQKYKPVLVHLKKDGKLVSSEITPGQIWQNAGEGDD